MIEQPHLPFEVQDLPSEAKPPAQPLITEAEVAFSTAAAAASRSEKRGWRTRVTLAVRHVFGSRSDRERRPPRHHPQRMRYLEKALMAREMDRL